MGFSRAGTLAKARVTACDKTKPICGFEFYFVAIASGDLTFDDHRDCPVVGIGRECGRVEDSTGLQRNGWAGESAFAGSDWRIGSYRYFDFA